LFPWGETIIWGKSNLHMGNRTNIESGAARQCPPMIEKADFAAPKAKATLQILIIVDPAKAPSQFRRR